MYNIDFNELGYLVKQVKRYNPITQEMAIKLLQNKQYDEVIKRTLPICMTIAKKYAYNQDEFLELYSEACEALCKNVPKYDINSGADFNSYCTQKMKDAVYVFKNYTAKLIKCSFDKYGIEIKVKKIQKELEQQLDRLPTLQEILDVLNDRYDYLNVKNIDTISYCFNTYTSFDNYVNDEDETFEDVLDFSKYVDSDNVFEVNESREANNFIIKSLLKCLTSEEVEIICKVFGVLGYKQMSSEDIEKEYGLTHSKYQQMIDLIYRKLRIAAGINKSYYQTHKDKQKEYAKNYYEANKDKIKAQNKSEEEKQKARERAKRYREKHPDVIKANREKIREKKMLNGL